MKTRLHCSKCGLPKTGDNAYNYVQRGRTYQSCLACLRLRNAGRNRAADSKPVREPQTIRSQKPKTARKRETRRPYDPEYNRRACAKWRAKKGISPLTPIDAQRVKALRKKLGLSQENMSWTLGYYARQIALIETGRVKRVRREFIEAFNELERRAEAG